MWPAGCQLDYAVLSYSLEGIEENHEKFSHVNQFRSGLEKTFRNIVKEVKVDPGFKDHASTWK